ncbi:DUF1577 domain-containing protein [Leptospira langatensis]|uniref:DUF1577 domain-containing protein n=1 Tax=Leptospira langatensis TaxID=2484983 RepID=A0A5F1ZWK9_9LEPT|nr:DUF1577 domain-containing protein [Leptospira langatensis]TGJ98342.1 DUF1577 domain-containing protein [Leptospira langatensis]TGL43255.1 DUF1577 domain-containing protein [Leptospira langatensis]
MSGNATNRTGRVFYRILIFNEEVYVSNLRTVSSNLTTDFISAPARIVRFVLEKFRSLLKNTPFQAALVDIFPQEMDPRFQAIWSSKKMFLIEDAAKETSFRLVDDLFINYEKEVSGDISSAMRMYEKTGIRSEIICPVLYSESSSDKVPVGFIRIAEKSSSLDKANGKELLSLTNSIVDEIHSLNSSQIDLKSKVVDISFSGIRLRIQDDTLNELPFQGQEFLLDLNFQKNVGIAVRASLKWWSRDSDGLLELGLEILSFIGGAEQRKRFKELIGEMLLHNRENSDQKEKDPNGEIVKERILHLDQDIETLLRVKSLLSENGFDVHSVAKVSEALDYSVKNSPSLIILDANLQNVNSEKLLRGLRRVSPGSIFIILSEVSKVHYLSWIWAHFEKSKFDEVLVESVREALDFYDKRLGQYKVAKSDQIGLKGEIEWLLWKDYHRNTEQLSFGKNVLNNITHSMSQGLGLGSMLIQIDLAEYMMKEDGADYVVPNDIMNSILESKGILKDWIDKLDRIRQLFHLDVKPERISANDIMERIAVQVKKLTKIALIKNNRIAFTNRNFFRDVSASKEVVDFVIHELLVNALKFSPKNTKIHVLVHNFSSFLCIDILNEMEVFGNHSEIAEQQFSLELFSRRSHNYDERFFSFDFGLGIGLNLANHLAEKTGAKLAVREVVDHSKEIKVKKVSAQILLPLMTEAATA